MRGIRALAVLAGLSLAALPPAGALAHDEELNEDRCHFKYDQDPEKRGYHCHLDTSDDGADWGKIGVALGSALGGAALVFLILEEDILAAGIVEIAPRDDGTVALEHHLGAGHHLGFESKSLPEAGHAKAFRRLRF